MGAQRFHVADQPVAAVTGRVAGIGGLSGAAGVGNDQLPGPAQAAQVTEVLAGPAGTAGQAHRGRFCYVSARLPGYRVPAPILRLRYQGSADQWAIGIYLASSDRYTEFELPTSFGPKTGTPEEGVDDTFILYAGPKTGH